MPFGSVRLSPGVNKTKTATLNEASISEGQLIRFREGLVQKMGGWVQYCSGPDDGGGEPEPEPEVRVMTAIFIIDGGGFAITAGEKGDFPVDFDCEITGVYLLADRVGSCVVDIWKAPFGEYPPTVDDSITVITPPTLSSADAYNDTILDGWTTTVTAGDTFRFNVVSASTIQRVTVALTLVRTVE